MAEKKMKHSRPPMKMSNVQPHQMPAPEHDGTPMPTDQPVPQPMAQQPQGMQGY
jgi:hypothetical protein